MTLGMLSLMLMLPWSAVVQFWHWPSNTLWKTQYELTVAVNWFRENGLRYGTRREFCFVASEKVIDEYDNVDLLGINVDNELKFTKHISNICERVSKQLQVFKRFRNLASVVMLKSVCIRPLYCLFFFIVLVSGLSMVLGALISWSCYTNVCVTNCIGWCDKLL